ncbi:MAG: TRAP transporter large permease [Methyloligellaceae bacterium]
MDPIYIGLIIIIAFMLLLSTGMPIAFALGTVSVVTLMFIDGPASISNFGEKLFGSLNSFNFVSIPMFILMGAAIAASPAGKDLYDALDRWLNKVPGGLVLSNLGACAIFAALSGSSPATSAAIGKMGIPEMRDRGYPDDIAAGSIAAGGTLGILIPPSITMIVYGIATETSIEQLFIAGILPGLLLTTLFMIATIIMCKARGIKITSFSQNYTFIEKVSSLKRVLPFLTIIVCILYSLYGGLATPSEAAGVGAFFCLIFVVVIYRMWTLSYLIEIFRIALLISVMIMMIIGIAEIFSFALSTAYVPQTIAQSIAELGVNKWVLLGIINVFLLVCGLFLPPVAVILMTTPVLLPIITAAGFDPIWFAVILTINMEIGLITPPVGLNLYIINSIAPDIELQTILKGALPYMFCMILAIIILCIFPEIVTVLTGSARGI